MVVNSWNITADLVMGMGFTQASAWLRCTFLIIMCGLAKLVCVLVIYIVERKE